MRASRQPGSAAIAASTSAIGGAIASAGASRSLPALPSQASSASGSRGTVTGGPSVSCPASRPCPGTKPSARNTGAVATAMPGCTISRPSRGRSSGDDKMSPMPRMMRGRGSRQTGMSAPVTRAASRSRGSSSERPLAAAMNRSAAAASADPPPSPAPAGSCLSSAKRPSLSPSIRSAAARTARNTRLSASGPESDAVGPVTVRPSGAPGQNVSSSPNGAKATRLSSA